MPGGVGGQRRKPLPTRLEEKVRIHLQVKKYLTKPNIFNKINQSMP
jgi:hypothetical protein